MSGFVYIWFDRLRKMYYIGSHWGMEDDGYICSSNRMRHAYRRRPQDFKRRIITKNFNSKKDLLDEEERFLSMMKKEELGKKYYNLNRQHFGIWHNFSEDKSKTINEKISFTLKGRKLPEETKAKMRGKKLSEEAKRNLSEKLAGIKRSEETKEKMRLVNLGKKHSQETKRKISEAKFGRKHSEETRKKFSERIGEKNPFFGKSHSDETKTKISNTKKEQALRKRELHDNS